MISFIIPTVGRPTLARTLKSIECWPDDEILVVGAEELASQVPLRANARFVACPPGNDWGSSERNFITPKAQGQYLAFMDDDDVFTPGHRAIMYDVGKNTPGRPTIFRMQYANGSVLWREQIIRCGNIGTPMFFMPNMPTMLGTWGPRVGGDCDYIETMKWKYEDVVWRPEVIALIRPNN